MDIRQSPQFFLRGGGPRILMSILGEMTSRKCWRIQRCWLAVDARSASVYGALVSNFTQIPRGGGLISPTKGMQHDHGSLAVGHGTVFVCSATCGPKLLLSMLEPGAHVCCWYTGAGLWDPRRQGGC